MPEGHVTHGLARDLRRTLRGTPVHATSPQGRFTEGAALVDGLAAGAHRRVGEVPVPRLRPRPSGPHPPRPHRQAPPDDSRWSRLHRGSGCAWRTTSTPGSSPVRPAARSSRPPRRRRSARRWAQTRCAPSRTSRRCAPGCSDGGCRIGAVLLDQTVIAGIGNVYRAELLFLRGIHPLRLASTLTDDEVAGLWAETVVQLRRGLRLNRIVTRVPGEVRRSADAPRAGGPAVRLPPRGTAAGAAPSSRPWSSPGARSSTARSIRSSRHPCPPQQLPPGRPSLARA